MTSLLWTECRNGHALTDPANVYITPLGHKRCRTCKRQSDRRTRLARGEGRRSYPNPPPVKADKYREWAVETWEAMSAFDRFAVAHALGYVTLEQAVA